MARHLGRGSAIVESCFRAVAHAVESSLKERLATGNWDALHLVVHGQARAAGYATIALEDSTRRARKLTGKYLAEVLSAYKSVRLVVLQDAGPQSTPCFDQVARALIEQGIAIVVAAPPLSGSSQRLFAAKLYGGLRQGLNAAELARELAAASSESGTAARVFARDMSTLAFATSPAVPEIAPIVQPNRRAEVDRKRAAGRFDVFLCHNSADKPAVERIRQQLLDQGILAWLDVKELAPGKPWQPELERQIKNMGSAAVFVGAAGIGPWQQREMYGFLDEFVNRDVPVIPVLLPDAPLKPDLPPFLRGMTWVDFRVEQPDPLRCLIWGITGTRPEE